jgi:CheY-like chemotaxis protein
MTRPPKGETLKGHVAPANYDGEGLTRVVHNAVYQAGTREQGDAAIREALRRAALESIPVAAGNLTAFVLGPLFDAVVQVSGIDSAERVVSILKPVLKRKSELELGEVPAAEAQRRTVLVVDEDIVVRAQLLSILNAAGYAAVSAPDANVALAMSVRCRPDLVISDMGLGRARDGQLAALLRVAFHADAPPIIILTHGEAPPHSTNGVCMLTKPIERSALLAVVEPLLRRTLPPN